MTSMPPDLSTLPFEIIEKIISLLLPIAYAESESKSSEKWNRAKAVLQPQDLYITCLHDQAPLLNSLQALGAVNRKLHQLCRPFLWRSLTFPGQHSIPMTFWLQDILPKHGTHVKLMKVTLSPYCTLSLRELSRPKELYDNTILLPITFSTMRPDGKKKDFSHYPFEPISPATLLPLLSLCPNLEWLNIDTSGLNPRPLEDFQLTHLLAFLISLTPTLHNLQSLTFKNTHMDLLPEELLAAFISRLPSLKYLDCAGFTKPMETNPKISLGRHVSRLRDLSTLRIYRVHGLNRSWQDYSWSQSLTELILVECCSVSTADIHQIVNHIGSNLIRLWIEFPFKRIEAEESDAEWIEDDRFELPAMTQLKMKVTGGHQFLSRFQNSSLLQRINFHSHDGFDWDRMTELVSKSTWPMLEFVTLEFYDYSGDGESNQTQEKFRQACHHAQIQLVINCVLHPFSNIQVFIGPEIENIRSH